VLISRSDAPWPARRARHPLLGEVRRLLREKIRDARHRLRRRVPASADLGASDDI
jgi:hypothetical protein